MIDMTKLRTLIQMEVPINDLNCDEYSTDLVATSEELRDEAIKYIKLWKSKISKDAHVKIKGQEISYFKLNMEDVDYIKIGQMSAFMTYLNITGKDIDEDD
jgi:hypothetical protein